MTDKHYVLVVTFANTWRTQVALNYEGHGFPYQFRTVKIPLTEQQLHAMRPRVIGSGEGGADVLEELYDARLETQHDE